MIILLRFCQTTFCLYNTWLQSNKAWLNLSTTENIQYNNNGDRNKMLAPRDPERIRTSCWAAENMNEGTIPINYNNQSVAGRDDATVVNTILPKLFSTRVTGNNFLMQTRFCSILLNEIWGSCLCVIIYCFYLHLNRLHEEVLQNAKRQKINLKVQRAV